MTPHRPLPKWLKPSAAVDLALVLSGARTTLRTELAEPITAEAVRRWARGLGLYVSWDNDGFLALSRKPGLSRKLLYIDAAPGDHLAVLGRLLGYPACCVLSARRVGEGGLDHRADALGARRHIGRFRSIDATDYCSGEGLVSHVPCGPSCGASVRIARVAALYLGGRATANPARLRTHPSPLRGSHRCIR